MYVQVKGSNRRVSMYSDWRLSKHNPNPVGLTSQMSCEDVDMQSALGAKDRRSSTPTSDRSQDASTSSRAGSFDVKLMSPGSGLTKDEVMEILSSKGGPVFRGGYKSEDMYEYIRGRGRGKYVCESCGIRCKKPSMLKKHLRTHTDFRPYHCHHCKFSFKTKGNLTKHMKSKAHQKRCLELGIFPVPVTVEESQIDEDALAKQCAIAKDARILDSELRGRSMLGGASFDGDGDDEDDDEDDQDDDDEDEGQPMEEGEDGRGRGMSDPGASPPVLMTAKESQRAPLQRSTALASISRELTSTPNLDTEIARSLLDLSRKVEAQGSGEVTAKSLETDEACQNDSADVPVQRPLFGDPSSSEQSSAVRHHTYHHYYHVSDNIRGHIVLPQVTVISVVVRVGVAGNVYST
nr:hypothetical protein BaRGS_021242 [Batillaria attramentaria]